MGDSPDDAIAGPSTSKEKPLEKPLVTYDEIGKTKDVPSSVLQHEANTSCKSTHPEESSDDVTQRKLDHIISCLENDNKQKIQPDERERGDAKKRNEDQEEKIQLERALEREREEGKKKNEDWKELWNNFQRSREDNEHLKRQPGEIDNRLIELKREHALNIIKMQKSAEQDLREQKDIHKGWKKFVDDRVALQKQTDRWNREQREQLMEEKLRLEGNLLKAKGSLKRLINTMQESSASTQRHEDILRHKEELQKALNIEVHVQEVEPSFKTDLISQIESDVIYNMQSFPKGTVEIINIMNFCPSASGPELSMRTGSEHDEWMLKQLFSDLGFKVCSHRNPNKQELLDIVEKARMEIKPASASFILVVLSHGTKGAIYAADGQKVLLGDLKAQIGRTLPAKPKMLIVNSCLGDEKTVNCLPVPDHDEEEPNTDLEALIESMPEVPTLLDSCPTSMPNDDQGTEDRRQQVPETADVITAYSTVHGYVSHRDEGGSLFIQNLVLVFAEDSHNTPVSEMLRKVRQSMAKHPTKPQVPQTESTLLKQWYLMPGM